MNATLKMWLGRIIGSQDRYLRISYSQEGEDLILDRLFERRDSGFYVDVGACHPMRFSNTHRFYRRGWHGINIEPNPEACELFRRRRKRDINIECGVADQEGTLVYFIFNESALNSFDKKLSEDRHNNGHRIIAKKNVQVRRLSKLLEEYLPAGTHIDFMSIDVEGYDLEVLKSNDWRRFRPECVLVEAYNFNLGSPAREPVHTFFEEQKYRLYAKTANTVFYLDQRSGLR